MRASFCLKCGKPLVERQDAVADGGKLRRSCPDPECGYVFYDNPLPVVAAIVELPQGVVLVRSKGWPPGLFGLVTGFLERGETPEEGVLREVKEELGLEAKPGRLVGAYAFPQFNQLILGYHVTAEGTPVASAELEALKIVPVSELKPWPFATGLALRDWLASRTG